MKAILEIKDLEFNNQIQYKDFKFIENKTTFISGPSGSGKSSLLKMLNSIYLNSGGYINYLDKNILEYEPLNLRREILLSSQNFYLFDLSIEQNFEKIFKLREQNLKKENINQFLELMDLKDIDKSTNCSLLSGGQRQRVFLAICLLLEPKVLLLDEPTSALNEELADKIINNISTYCLNKNITLIIVSHNKKIIKKYADFEYELKGNKNNE